MGRDYFFFFLSLPSPFDCFLMKNEDKGRVRKPWAQWLFLSQFPFDMGPTYQSFFLSGPRKEIRERTVILWGPVSGGEWNGVVLSRTKCQEKSFQCATLRRRYFFCYAPIFPFYFLCGGAILWAGAYVKTVSGHPKNKYKMHEGDRPMVVGLCAFYMCF